MFLFRPSIYSLLQQAPKLFSYWKKQVDPNWSNTRGNGIFMLTFSFSITRYKRHYSFNLIPSLFPFEVEIRGAVMTSPFNLFFQTERLIWSREATFMLKHAFLYLYMHYHYHFIFILQDLFLTFLLPCSWPYFDSPLVCLLCIYFYRCFFIFFCHLTLDAISYLRGDILWLVTSTHGFVCTAACRGSWLEGSDWSDKKKDRQTP